MISRLYASLPGPAPLRAALMVLIAAAAAMLLILCYDWLGNTFLDTGGRIG